MCDNKIGIILVSIIYIWPSVCFKLTMENQKGLDVDMQRIRKKLDCRGFTLLEVMIGLVIFSIGLLTLLSMLVVSISGNAWSEKTTRTVQMVRQTIETIKNTPENQLENYGYEDEDGIFRHWYIQDFYEGQTSVKMLTVWVYWNDEFNRPQYTSTTTIFHPKQ